MINFTPDQIDLIYEAIRAYRDSSPEGSDIRGHCNGVLNLTYPYVNARRQRRETICDA